MVVPTVRRARLDLAATCLVASAVTGGVAVVALGGMFAAFGTGNQQAGEVLGFINDVLAFPTLLLVLPAMAELRRLLRPEAPAAVDGITLLAALSIAGVLVLQGMLVLRLIPFEQQVGPVMLAYLGLQAWYLVVGVLGSRAGLLPKGGRMGILAVSYVGFPAWAIWLARRFRELARAATPAAAAPTSAAASRHTPEPAGR